MKTNIFYTILIFSFLFSYNLYSQSGDGDATSHTEDVENYRNAKNQMLTDSEQSPLTAEQIEKFEELAYFPIDINYKINAQLTVDENQKEVSLSTTSGENISLIKYGSVTFSYGEETYTLSVFKNNNLPEFGSDRQQLFIPFKDGTSGKGSNANGRYITIEVEGESNTVEIDFNMAINPYSAYNSQYSSVIPPSENTLIPSMSSGERKFEDR